MSTDAIDAGTAEVHAEIAAMSVAWEAMRELPGDSRERALRWLAAKLGVNLEGSAR